MIMVEQQLKFQNEKLEMMMDSSDKRFDAVQRTMDKRFLIIKSLSGQFRLVFKVFFHPDHPLQ